MVNLRITGIVSFIGGALGSVFPDIDYIPQAISYISTGNDFEPAVLHSFRVWLILSGIFVAFIIGQITTMVLMKTKGVCL